MNVEQTIIQNLIQNENYATKVIPFIKPSYFSNLSEKRLFLEIKDHILKYNKSPDFSTIDIELSQSKGMTAEGLLNCREILDNLKKETPSSDIDWLIDTTEKFCQNKAIYLAMIESMQILDGKSAKAPGMIPELLSDALSISFDPNIGHDYFEDYMKQFDYYNTTLVRIPFDLDILNKITKGGIPSKSFTCAIAGTNVGKTALMCSLAGGMLLQGYDVLYVTAEMSQEEIRKRIDANILDCSLDDIDNLPMKLYTDKILNLKKKTAGKLIIKEYPTSEASSTHVKMLLDDLKLKKKFKPHIIFLDYINLFASSRLKPGVTGSYGYVKAVSEEMRGIAIRYDTRIFTATQTNRTGFASSDVDLTHTADSFGIPQTADFMFSVVTSPELEKLNQLLFTQLKNRFASKITNKQFVVGIDWIKMRFYDVEQKAQSGLVDIRTGIISENKSNNGKKVTEWKI